MKRFNLCMLIVLTVLPCVEVIANPVGGQVTLGTAVIDQTQVGITEVSQATDRVVLDWQSFGIGENELVRFSQPSASAIAVNRDLSGELSQIHGDLEANGNVFIMNPAGILFGANAFVNVGGLVATDLDFVESLGATDGFLLEDPDTATGGIINEGLLQANTNSIALIGQQIVNSGNIQTRTGDVHMISASEVTVLIDTEGVMGYELTKPVQNLLSDSDFLIKNTADGLVASVDGGDVIYSTQLIKDLLSGGASIRQEGIDNVFGITNQAGDIYISEIQVDQALLDTALEDKIVSDSVVVYSDINEISSTIDGFSEILVSADELTLDPAASASENQEGRASEDPSRVASEDRQDDSITGSDEESEQEKAKVKVDPAYFAKFRKTHIDQLIPECQAGVECEDKQNMKDFLGKLLVDGGL